jgi:tetratricopeptide (TPR) repeat protein
MIQAMRAKALGDNETAILHLRRAVELQPLNADYHFQLGALLGQTGKVEEGIEECKKSVEIKPDWDLPGIEAGIILGNHGRYEESKKHLEECAKSFRMTSHLAHSLGYARMHCNEYKGALDVFEIVLEEKPQHAQALDCAAHCCFMLGQTERGLALAKEALKYGAKDTYQDWQNGKYRGSKRK